LRSPREKVEKLHRHALHSLSVTHARILGRWPAIVYVPRQNPIQTRHKRLPWLMLEQKNTLMADQRTARKLLRPSHSVPPRVAVGVFKITGPPFRQTNSNLRLEHGKIGKSAGAGIDGGAGIRVPTSYVCRQQRAQDRRQLFEKWPRPWHPKRSNQKTPNLNELGCIEAFIFPTNTHAKL